MDIESELPENFDDLTDDEKIKELRKLEELLDDETDAGILKKRMVEELIRVYSD